MLNDANTLPIVQAFVSQLRSLLGIGSPKQKTVTILPDGHRGAAEWELDVAVRKAILNNLRQSKSEGVRACLSLTFAQLNTP